MIQQSHQQGVSIITCTNRPHFFNNLLANFNNQRYQVKELIIVLNKDTMGLIKYRKIVRSNKYVAVYKMPEKVSLGRCLNYAISKSKYPFIAKFDDDDYYSPYYLTEQMKAIHRSGASIVGKHSHLLYLEGRKLLIMRYPNQSNKFVGFVSGGTILFNKRLFNHVRFDDTSLGEDVNFLRKSRSRGFKIYSASPFNWVGIRRINKKSHTWAASDKSVMEGSRILAKTDRFRKIAVRVQ